MKTNFTSDTEELATAKAETAPPSILAELTSKYQEAVLQSPRGYLFDPFCSSDHFELAVLKRNDDYSNLILAGAATNDHVCQSLWDVSDKGSDLSPLYREALKKSLLEGPGLQNLINERLWGEAKQAKFSLISLLAGDDYKSMSSVVSNRYCKGFFERILRGEGPYANIPKENYPYILIYMSQNPALNEDRSDSEMPDNVHWGFKKALLEILQTAPTTAEWFVGIESIVEKVEREGFSFYGFPVEEFCGKWINFEMQSKSSNPSGQIKNGFYTTLSKVEEMVSLFCAKFGSQFLANKTYSIFDALSETQITIKAAFFGNADLPTSQVAEALNARDPNIVYWLLQNDAVMLNANSRALIEGRVGIARGWVFKERSDRLRTLDPDAFIVVERQKNEKELSDYSHKQLPSEAFEALSSRILSLEKSIRRMTVAATLIAAAIILLN